MKILIYQNLKSEASSRRGFTLMELIVVVVIAGLLAAIAAPLVGTAIKRAKITASEKKLDALNEALQLYYDCQFDLPSSLSALEPNYIRSAKYSGDYAEDAWRKAIVYSRTDSKTATLTSYGPDRASGGGDDITYNVTCMSIYRDYKKETEDELREVNRAAENYVRDGYSLNSSITSADSVFSTYLSDDKYKYDPWGKRSAPGAARSNGQAYRYDPTNKTFYSYGPDGASGGGDDIYPPGYPGS